MIAVLQRVNSAQIKIDNKIYADIEQGLVALVGVEKGDDKARADKLLEKILSFRIFSDEEEKMNLDICDVGGDLLLVSQFTLVADTSQGHRPGFSTAMPPEQAEELYDYMVDCAHKKFEFTQSGRFGADMKVGLENDGPVTFILNS